MNSPRIRLSFAQVADTPPLRVAETRRSLDLSLPQFVVLSSGHGSDFVAFDGEDVAYACAVHEAVAWVRTADTIGGDAVVVHVPSMAVVWSWRDHGNDDNNSRRTA